MKSFLLNFSINRPLIVIGIVLVLTIVFGLALRRGLALNVSPLLFIAEHSSEREDFNRVRDNFGDDLFLVAAVVSEDAFAPANIDRLRKLHQQIEQLDGIDEIISLANAPYARGDAKGASIEKLLPEKADANRIVEAKSVALHDKLFAGQIISRDGKTAALTIIFKAKLSTDQRYALTEQIYNLAKNAGFQQSYFAGDPFMQWRGVEAIRRDLSLFLPLTILLVAFLLWLSFRTVVAVILPLLTVGIGLIWVFGVMNLAGSQFSLLSLMLPTLLLAIGCSYIIHVFNQIGIEVSSVESQSSSYEGSQHSALRTPHSALLSRALDFISIPVIVSALTIIAGFLSLGFTKIPGIRTTAIYAALGALVTMILALTFVPAVLCLLGEKAIRMQAGLSGKLVITLERIGRFAVSKEKWLYFITAVMCLLSVIGIFRIIINVDYFGFFKANSEGAIGTAEIGKRLAGAISFDVILESKNSNAFEDPKILARVEELENYTESVSDGQALSVPDFLKHGNRAFHNNDPNQYVLPTDERIVRELMTDREQLGKFLSTDGKTLRILVRPRLSGSAAMSKAVEAIEAKGKEILPEVRTYATGTVALMNRTSDAIAREQIQSVGLALLTIYLVLSLLFKSWRVGITALVPNLIPVLFFFGYMGWTGTPLNMTTSIVASVVLGLAVDNAVQFIVRFRRVQPEFSNVRDAIIESLRLTGRPIIYANIAIASAFAVFALSNFWPVATFGILSAVTILGCLVEDLVLLPARLTSPVFRAISKE